MKRKIMLVTLFTMLVAMSVCYSKTTPLAEVFGQAISPVHADAEDETRADQAEVNIKAPDRVKVGDMIVVDLSDSLGDGFDYEVEPTPPGLRTFNNGQIIVCGTGGKNVTYTFMVSCALGGDSDIAVHKVIVEGEKVPTPPSDPGDNLVKKVKAWASDVYSPTKRDDALALSQSFASIAIIIDSGTFSTNSELVAATAASNRDALGHNLDKWTPVLNSLMSELKAMAQLGKLPDVQSHSKVWKDVARGLKEYANTLD